MKVVVATSHLQGQRETDFSWTVDGELVMTQALECDSEHCGCWRGFAGLASHKATTTAMVVDLPAMTLELLRQAVADSLDAQGWRALLSESEADEAVDEIVEDQLVLADFFGVGAILECDREKVSRRGFLPEQGKAA